MSFSINISILVACITVLFQLAVANVEKVIFVAPHPQPVPPENLAFDDLGLHRLSPSTPIVRTYLNASFPTEDQQLGTESWFYLEDLAPGTRYEARICWLATQPTGFILTTHTITEVVSDPALLAALTKFSAAFESSSSSITFPSSSLFSRHPMLSSSHSRSSPDGENLDGQVLDKLASYIGIPHTSRSGFHLHKHIFRRRSRSMLEKIEDPLSLTSHAESVLFLRIFAAAEYVSADPQLMEEVPPVLVDIILDEYLFNVLPRSLVPTIAWMATVGFVAWWLGGWAVQGLVGIVSSAITSDNTAEKHKPKQKHGFSEGEQRANQVNSMEVVEGKKDL